MGGGGVEIEVPRRGGFHESNFDGACTRERNVVIGKPPLFGLRVCDEEAGGDLGGLRPGWIQGRIVNSVAVEVGECFSKIPSFICVGIDERFEAGAVAVLRPCGGIVVFVVGIGDRVPDFLNGRVGADHHLVTGTADGVSVVGRECENALWGFRIIVESLGEGVVERRLVGTTAEEGAGTKDVETFGKTRLHSEGPVLIRLAKGRGAGVVVVREMLDGRRVEISHAECGEHFLFVGNCRFASRPPRGCSVGILIFKETDLVVEGGARGWLWNVSRGPPVVCILVVAVI